jgi:hypothetical protein
MSVGGHAISTVPVMRSVVFFRARTVFPATWPLQVDQSISTRTSENAREQALP